MPCGAGEPPDCIFKGGLIEYGDNGEAVCSVCGIQAPLTVYDTKPSFEGDELMKGALISKTGAKRGRDKARGRLFGDAVYDQISGTWRPTEVGLVNEYALSANAVAETDRVYREMMERGYHLGGKGLDAVVHAAIFYGSRFDYNFVPMSKIVKGDSVALKKANGLIKRARRDKIIERVAPDPFSNVKSALQKRPRSIGVQELAEKYAKLRIPNLRPHIHAAGALYKSLKVGGNSSEKRTTQQDVADEFHISRKNVGQGYRAINGVLKPKSNPGHSPDLGLTAAQVRLLRRLR